MIITPWPIATSNTSVLHNAHTQKDQQRLEDDNETNTGRETQTEWRRNSVEEDASHSSSTPSTKIRPMKGAGAIK